MQARREILQAAQNILGAGGPEAVTLESVAGELGMTKQALYHYFPSKEVLMRTLVTSLIEDEVETLIVALDKADSGRNILGTLVRAFYNHYINNLNAFRTVYCQSQIYSASGLGMDDQTIRDEINPRTQHLFDIVETRLAGKKMSRVKRARMRRLAFTAWTAALGLVTMLSVADAMNDPLIHSDADLLDTLIGVFDQAATR